MAWLPPPLSRSISSSSLRSYCQKKYYLQYYAHRLKSINSDLRLENLLYKNLSSYKMRIGTHTHYILSDYLNLLKYGAIKVDDIQKVMQRVRMEMTNEFHTSEEKDYTRYDKHNKFGLTEHAFNRELPENALDDAITTVYDNLESFRLSELHNEIEGYMRNETSKVFIEDRQPNFDQMKIVLDHIPELKDVIIWAQPDAGIITGDNHFIIYDWKSGSIKPERRENPLSEQLKVYALKLLANTHKTLDDVDIEGYEIYVPSMERFGGQITRSNIETIQEKIISDVTTIKKYLEDEDVVINKPVAIEKFARTDNENKCKSCRFQTICKKLKQYEKHSLF